MRASKIIPIIASGGSAPPLPIALGSSFYISVSPQYCTSDVNHLVPCNNGDPITSWYEQVSKTWFTWATVDGAGAKPIFVASGSSYSANFATNGAFPFPNMWPQGDVSIVMKFTPQAQVGHYLGEGSDFGNRPYTFYRSTTTGVLQRYNTGPSWTLTNGASSVLSYQGSGTSPTSTEKTRLNGGAWSTVSNTRPSRSGTSATVAVGIGGAGAGRFTNFKALSISPFVQPDANFTAIESFIDSIP